MMDLVRRFGRSLALWLGLLGIEYPMRNVLFTIALAGFSIVLGCGGNGPNNGSNGPALTSISVTAASGSIVVNQTVQMTATGTYSDHTKMDLTNSVSWSSSSTSLATISASGVLTAISNGKVSITATMNSVSGSSQVTIAPALVSIAITPSRASIARETALQFTATGSYTDNSMQNITASVNWSSSNTSVATVSNTSPTKGLVQGVSAGTVTISATSGSISGTTSLTVTSATATSLAIAPTNASLALDVSQQFTATATFSDGTSQDVTNVVSWSSRNSSIATITVSGLATAKNLGTTNIAAAFESTSASTSLTVNASNLKSISIAPANGSIAQGTNVSFTATGTFNDGSTHNLTNQVMWFADTSIAKWVAVGVAEGIVPGSVNITATLGSVSDSVPLIVTNATIQSITVTPYAQTIPTGWYQAFTATGLFSDHSTQDISTVVHWKSNNPPVATIQGNFGTVYAAGQGTANITAYFSYANASATGTAPLTVSSAVLKSISLAPASALLAPGAGRQYNAVGTWSDGSSENISLYVAWSSSNNSVAQVNSIGLVTGESAGVATINVQQGSSLSAAASLVVEGSALLSIQVTPQGSRVPATIEESLQATGNFADGQSLDLTSAVSWTSSSPSVATISNAFYTHGVATGIAPGTTTITAVFSGQSGTATLTVTNATLDSITVSPANPTITLGASEQFEAHGTFSDGSVLAITDQAAWSSSNVAVAAINSVGVASSASAGTSTIKASLNGVSGTTNLTVQ